MTVAEQVGTILAQFLANVETSLRQVWDDVYNFGTTWAQFWDNFDTGLRHLVTVSIQL